MEDSPRRRVKRRRSCSCVVCCLLAVVIEHHRPRQPRAAPWQLPLQHPPGPAERCAPPETWAASRLGRRTAAGGLPANAGPATASSHAALSCQTVWRASKVTQIGTLDLGERARERERDTRRRRRRIIRRRKKKKNRGVGTTQSASKTHDTKTQQLHCEGHLCCLHHGGAHLRAHCVVT